MKFLVFRDVTLCRSVYRHQRFGGASCISLQDSPTLPWALCFLLDGSKWSSSNSRRLTLGLCWKRKLAGAHRLFQHCTAVPDFGVCLLINFVAINVYLGWINFEAKEPKWQRTRLQSSCVLRSISCWHHASSSHRLSCVVIFSNSLLYSSSADIYFLSVHYEVKRKVVYGEHIRPTVCDPMLGTKRFVIFYWNSLSECLTNIFWVSPSFVKIRAVTAILPVRA